MILQYIASFAIALVIFYIFYRILKVVLFQVDKCRRIKYYNKVQEFQERDRLDEERGREERRKSRLKEQ